MATPDLLVGVETSDDAAVVRLTDELALVTTVDFITPPVDDPWWFGQIAAANSLSDIYAMGGRPLVALNLVMFPEKILDVGILREILRGGAEKVAEAGASLGGGHSVNDEEPKYGLAVQGLVHPDRILTNAGAKPGDVLVLSKPLGTGVILNAVRDGRFAYADCERDVLPGMAMLNRDALEVAQRFDVHAVTDVTGFGIGGHGLEMALGARVSVVVRYSALPLIDGAVEMYRLGQTTGSNKKNRALCQGRLDLKTSLQPHEEEMLYDPQTSGGLLVAVPRHQGAALVAALLDAGMAEAAVVADVETGTPGVVVA